MYHLGKCNAIDITKLSIFLLIKYKMCVHSMHKNTGACFEKMDFDIIIIAGGVIILSRNTDG